MHARLLRELSAGSSKVWTRTDAGLHVQTLALPFDAPKLGAYFSMAVRGLLWYHWSFYLSAEASARAMFVTPAAETMVDRWFSLKAGNSVPPTDLGNGTIEYRAVQGADQPDFSIWQFWVYGGLTLGGHPKIEDTEKTSIAVITAPVRLRLDPQRRFSDELCVETLPPR